MLLLHPEMSIGASRTSLVTATLRAGLDSPSWLGLLGGGVGLLITI